MTGKNTIFSFQEMELNRQLHGVQKNLKQNAHGIDDLGSILPAAVMLHDLNEMQPLGVNYMNNWGCERLGTSAEEVNTLGEAYYERYFIKEESLAIFKGIQNYLDEADFSKQYNFFQRVKLHNQTDYTWFYSICKLLEKPTAEATRNQMIILSSPVEGIDRVIGRVSKVLDEDHYIKNHYKQFALLTKQEKNIIDKIAKGKSSKEIAEALFISVHTVRTHRKNIIRKTESTSFAELLKFAMAFELV
ncbi:Transcriptional regulatory protein TdiR [Chryseobacterium salivictor]|uniref:Transcriptional regulatory protein TdiR n=2 Tax=Chryseobacterium TaxID=59732 RepID=A0A4P6ZI48_9FLAO|nr:Transcriptional regulatory protein TdiR [Chryseobacterium salivictor]